MFLLSIHFLKLALLFNFEFRDPELMTKNYLQAVVVHPSVHAKAAFVNHHCFGAVNTRNYYL